MGAASRVVLDVTSIVGWNTTTTGIHRVQLDVAVALANRATPGVEFCRYDRSAGVYLAVPPSEVVAAAARVGGVPDTIAAGATPPALPSWYTALQRRLPATAPAVRASLSGGRLALRGAVDVGRGLRADWAARRTRCRVGCVSEGWTPEVTYCSLGFDLSDNDVEYLGACASKTGCRVVLTVYDLIPHFSPQYFASKRPLDTGRLYRATLEVADRVLVPSESTRRDVERFAASVGLPSPPTARLVLGSALLDTPIESGAGAFDDLEPATFVLCVGTVEIRKNHGLLLDVWEALAAETAPETLPRLVVAGKRGWLTDATLSRMSRTPALRGVVTFVENPADAQLAWLYRHCAYTVFPSLAEGWGLPVTESLDFGKACLASNRGGVPEAGEGLVELLDPTDRAAWRAAVLSLWQDRELRARRERAISDTHRRVTVHDTVRSLLAASAFGSPGI